MGFLLVFFGVIGLVLFILSYSAFVWGFVTHCIYGWFILTIFPDAPHLTVYHFVGIALFVRSLHPINTFSSIKDEYQDTTKSWIMVFVSPWLVLLFAWFIHLFN